MAESLHAQDLLIELGCEELPPGALPALAQAFFELTCAALENEAIVQWFASSAVFGPVFAATSKLTPFLIVCAVFSFLYWYMPNTDVRLGSVGRPLDVGEVREVACLAAEVELEVDLGLVEVAQRAVVVLLDLEAARAGQLVEADRLGVLAFQIVEVGDVVVRLHLQEMHAVRVAVAFQLRVGRQRLVEGVGVQRLGMALRRRHRLDHRAHDVVVGVLCGQRPARGLAVGPQRQ